MNLSQRSRSNIYKIGHCYRINTKNTDPDQIPQNAASDQGLFGLLT